MVQNYKENVHTVYGWPGWPLSVAKNNNRYKISIINVQLQQDFQNPVCGWLLVATTLVFPTYILSSLTSSLRAEISVSSQEWHYWGPGWPTLIGHWVSSQPRVLPHLSLFCPSSPPLSCEASWETTKSNIKVHTNITHYCRIDYCHQCDKIYITKSNIKVHTDITTIIIAI